MSPLSRHGRPYNDPPTAVKIPSVLSRLWVCAMSERLLLLLVLLAAVLEHIAGVAIGVTS